MSKVLINKSSLAEIVIAANQKEYEAPQLKLTINEIIKAEASASLIDAMVFTGEAAAILTKGSNSFINQLKM